MDPMITDLLDAGRRRFRAGDGAAAIAAWKEAMRIAYTKQAHAAAFVLSKNLGDAALEESYKHSTAGIAWLDEAVGYYDYALELLDMCGLGEALGEFANLAQVVRYIRRRRRRAERLQAERDQLQSRHDTTSSTSATPPVKAPAQLSSLRKSVEADVPVVSVSLTVQEEESVCTTCGEFGVEGNPIVIDEADNCPYCHACFSEYYASVTGDETPPMPLNPSANSESSVEDELTLTSLEAKSTTGDEFALGHGKSSSPTALIVPTLPSTASVGPSHPECGTEDDDETELDDDQHEGTSAADVSTVKTAPALASKTAARQQYTIDQLKQLRSVARSLPCPAALKSSVVLASAISTTKQPTESKHTKRPKQERPGPRQDADPPRVTLLPSLNQCLALQSSNPASAVSALGLAEAFFDGDTTIGMPLRQQLQLLSDPVAQ